MSAASVILWWGADIRVLEGETSIARHTLAEREDPVPVILRMVGEERHASSAVRIIYHPDTLDVHEMACPNTSRSRLRRILAREYPALSAPDAVWSAEPISQGREGYGTVCYLDTRSRLPRLLQGLARRGRRVEGVWPLQSLVEATPPCEMGEGGFLSLVALGGQALVSCAVPSGERSVQFYDGQESADAAIAGRQTALARFDEGTVPPELVVIEESPRTRALQEALPASAPAGMSLAAFLGQARFLPSGGFSDFLPRPSLWSRRPAPWPTAVAVGLVLLAGFAWFARTARQNRERAQAQIAAGREQHLRLQQTAALSREVARLTQALDRARAAPQIHYQFLTALAQATPPAIALQTVTIQDGIFVIHGHIYEGAGRPDSPLLSLRRDLAPAEAPWHLEAAATATTEADFTLQGSFPPADPTLPATAETATAADLHARWASTLGRLTAAAVFDAGIPGWSRNWSVQARTLDSFPDLEVRSYGLVYDHPTMSSWADILETVKKLCAEPGLSIDHLALIAAPDGADVFQQVEISFAVRLRP